MQIARARINHYFFIANDTGRKVLVIKNISEGYISLARPDLPFLEINKTHMKKNQFGPAV